jgi:hypothetical protein
MIDDELRRPLDEMRQENADAQAETRCELRRESRHGLDEIAERMRGELSELRKTVGGLRAELRREFPHDLDEIAERLRGELSELRKTVGGLTWRAEGDRRRVELQD